MSVDIRRACLRPLKASEWLQAIGSDNREQLGHARGSEERSPPLDKRIKHPQMALGGLFGERVHTQAKREILRQVVTGGPWLLRRTKESSVGGCQTRPAAGLGVAR